ncbi:hypothetical protein B0I35DRAFT_10126 [Stachybotrys elegans]|uniref:Uncharacterized protein n=1 Tax=Stachybotrys elegans TaxID=80388 RepID=A0A8K0T1H6_9HYPO|nr:hypothetical protein B0I35DRAFT_10126 [Stachybotrys elegans]
MDVLSADMDRPAAWLDKAAEDADMNQKRCCRTLRPTDHALNKVNTTKSKPISDVGCVRVVLVGYFTI